MIDIRKLAVPGLILAGATVLAGCGDTTPGTSPSPTGSAMMDDGTMHNDSMSPSPAMSDDAMMGDESMSPAPTMSEDAMMHNDSMSPEPAMSDNG